MPDRAVPLRKRVDAMTDAEMAKMPEWAAKWIAIGLSTERADRPLFEAAPHACYRLSGHAPPKAIVWAPCPIVVAYAGPIAQHWAKRLTKSDSVHASVSDSVSASVHGERIDCTVYVNNYFGGQFWVGGWGWGNAYQTFMLDVLGLDIGLIQELKCRAYAATAMAACWSYWTTDFVIVSERPSTIRKRSDGTLEIAEWTWTDADGRACRWAVEP